MSATMSRQMTRLAVVLSVVAGVAADKVGSYFESDDCVDPKGFESCYKEADEAWASCVDDNCKDQDIDCINVCSCIQNLDQLDCAGRSCWNQVYSCEYQSTVSELTSNCLNPKYDRIPFWPPPDNAKAGCSCNGGKLTMAQVRTTDEMENKCGIDLLENTSPSNDLIQDIVAGCLCCAGSAFLSAIWDICPNTDPKLLGADEWYGLILQSDENWSQCGQYMDAYPCADKLGMTPPAGDKSNFYKPGDLPANGTQTLFNTGVVTSPVAGATYSYSYWDDLVRVVTVVSADAKPTSSGGNDNDDDDESNDREENSGNENDDDNDDSEESGGSRDGGSSAEFLSPQLIMVIWPLTGMAMLASWL